MCRASVVIVTYRRDQVLIDTLHSVLAVLGPDDELIVVDQDPQHPPHVAGMLSDMRHRPRVRLIELAAPSMPGARNVGVAAAVAPILIFVDDDVVVRPGFIEAHVARYADATVGAVAGHIEDPRGQRVSFGSGAYTTKLVGANMSFRRHVLFEVGGFDTNLYSTIRDDGDCGERIRRGGWRIANGRDCGLVHLADASGGAGGRHRTNEWFRKSYHNCMYVFLKRPWYRIVSGWPRYMVGTLRHWNPGWSRFASPAFFWGVFVRGHLAGIQTRRHAPPGPFLVAEEGTAGASSAVRARFGSGHQ